MNYNLKNPEEYDNRYKSIPREKYLKEHWRPLIYKVIKTYCKNKNIIDLGSGTGIYTHYIKKYSNASLGLDLAEQWLKYSKNKHRSLDLIKSDVLYIPIKNQSIDVVVSIGLLEYVEKNLTMKEINRIMKKDAILIISIPNKYSASRLFIKLISKIRRKNYISKELSKKEMLILFKNYNFKLVDYWSNDGLIWLPDALDKFIGKFMYLFIEHLFRVLGENPFSNIMLFICKKISNSA